MTSIFVSALLTLGLASPGFAADRGNLQLFHNVSRQVTRYAYFTIFDAVHANVNADNIILRGCNHSGGVNGDRTPWNLTAFLN